MNSLDFNKRPEDTRVVVAMSGGVDSSVVAGILKKEGYEVIGITLQLYDHGAAVHRAGSCCAGQDIDDARRVCETLGIPHYVLDYERRFRDAVINPFMESYVAGETPIPCVACNQTVKFADLLITAKELGADALATGHYIRSQPAPTADHPERRALYRPIDAERDQSYFLFATTQEQIDYLRFPLGGMSKAEVRVLAAEMGLVVAEKADSQDICFVPQGRYSDVITKLRPIRSWVARSCISTAVYSARMRASCITRSASAAASASPSENRFMWFISTPVRAASSSARRKRSTHGGFICAT